MINKGLLKHSVFWIGFLTAFYGAFEQAIDAGTHPIFGNGLGFPFLHHYVTGFIIILFSYFWFNLSDWILMLRRMRYDY